MYTKKMNSFNDLNFEDIKILHRLRSIYNILLLKLKVINYFDISKIKFLNIDPHKLDDLELGYLKTYFDILINQIE